MVNIWVLLCLFLSKQGAWLYPDGQYLGALWVSFYSISLLLPLSRGRGGIQVVCDLDHSTLCRNVRKYKKMMPWSLLLEPGQRVENTPPFHQIISIRTN